MAYASKTELEAAIPPERQILLTQDDESVQTVDTNTYTWALGVAESKINRILAARYHVPIDTANGGETLATTMTTMTVAIAIWQLYKRRTTIEMPPNVQTEYDETMTFLKNVAESKTGWSLDIADNKPDPVTPADEVGTLSPPRFGGAKPVLGRADWEDAW